MENLIGRKIRGFKFESSLDLGFDKKMDKYIDEVGDILEVDETSVGVRFKDSEYWYYPKEEALKHLVPDVEEGKCYTATRHNIELCFISDKVDDISVWNKGSMLDISDGIIDNCVGFFNFEDFIITETPERLPWLEYCIKENKYIPEEEFNSLCNQPISGILQIEDKEIDSPKNEEVDFEIKEALDSFSKVSGSETSKKDRFGNKDEYVNGEEVECFINAEWIKCQYVGKRGIFHVVYNIFFKGNHLANIGELHIRKLPEKQTKRMTLNEALNILADKLGVDEIEIVD